MRYLACLLGLLTALAAQAAEPPALETTPPVVVKTEPQAGRADVPASTTEIRVTFSKPMRDGSWSWSYVSPESFPKMTGQPHYSEDRRTCVLPVSLEPGKTYVIWLNHPPSQNFVDDGGRKALEYLLVFGTAK